MTIAHADHPDLPLAASTTAESTARPAPGRGARWAGIVMTALPGLFLLVDAVMKFVQPAPVIEATVKLGYPESTIPVMGTVLLVSTLLALIPRTAVLGTILLTGYLGGAVATHLRVGGSAFEMLFPVVFGVLLWGGLWLRDPRLRALLPLRA